MTRLYMSAQLRERRIINERQLLQELARANKQSLAVLEHSVGSAEELLSIVIRETCGIVQDHNGRVFAFSHPAVIRFPKFFPSVPIEANLQRPVFHPNIDPETGFVCLWRRSSAGDTVVEAVKRLQQIICWRLMNLDKDHVMQPDAVSWYQNPKREIMLPLNFEPIFCPGSCSISYPTGAGLRKGTHRRLEVPTG